MRMKNKKIEERRKNEERRTKTSGGEKLIGHFLLLT